MVNKKIIIGIVDDHQIVIDGLVSLLKSKLNIKVAFVSTEPLMVIELIRKHPIDILLTDVVMPSLSGDLLARQVKEIYPQIKILALSMSGEGNIVDEMIRTADIAGYALKNISQLELYKAIEKIHRGGIYFSPLVIENLNKIHRRKNNVPQPINLTIREIEIIKLLEKELNNKQIANQLFISEYTVETHRKNIFRKTETNSLIGLVKYAYQHKLI